MKNSLLIIFALLASIFGQTEWGFHSDLNTIYEMALHDDYLFIGTPSGIAKVEPDGSYQYLYSAQDGFAGVSVTRLLEDQSGTLWYSTEDGYIGRYVNDKWQVFLDLARINISINDILFLDGDILAATDRGIYRIKVKDNFLVGQIEDVYRQIADLPDESQFFDLYLYDNKLWAGHANGVVHVSLENDMSFPDNWTSIEEGRGVVEMIEYNGQLVLAFQYESEYATAFGLLEGESIEPVWEGTGAANRVVTNMFVQGDSLWAVGGDKFPAYHVPHLESFYWASTDLPVPGSYSVIAIDGKIYFGLKQLGLGYFEEGEMISARLQGPVGNEFSSYVNHQGIDVVVADDIGINWQDGQGWDYLTVDEHNFDEEIEDKMESILTKITSIEFDHLGRIWIASWGYGIAKGNLETMEFEIMDHSNSELIGASDESFPVVTDIERDSLNNMWVVLKAPSSHFPVLIYGPEDIDGNSKMKIGSDYSPLSDINDINTIDVRDQKAWIGTELGEVLGMDWHGFITDTLYYTWYFYRAEEIPGGRISDVAVDSKGHVWVGTDNGLARIEPEIDEVFDIVLPDNITPAINGIAIDKWDNIWLATPNGGLVISGYSGEFTVFRPIFESEAWPEQRTAITSDNILGVGVNPVNQDVWFLTDAGISVLSRSITDEEDEITEIKVYPNPADIGAGQSVYFSELPINSFITIYTSSGDPVINLEPQDADFAGRFVWDGRNSSGTRVASGIYLFSVTGGGSQITGSFVIR